MNDPKKLAIVVLAVVAVLFAGAVATGAFSDQGSSDPGDPENDWAAAIGERTGGAVTIDPAALAIECRDPNDPLRLVFAFGCDIDVPPGDGLRLVRIQAGSRVEVTAPAPSDDTDFEVSDDLSPGETVAVAVGASGATIELDCEELGDCAVVLVAGE